MGAMDAGLGVYIEAPSVKAPSMTAAIDQYLAEHNGVPQAEEAV